MQRRQRNGLVTRTSGLGNTLNTGYKTIMVTRPFLYAGRQTRAHCTRCLCVAYLKARMCACTCNIRIIVLYPVLSLLTLLITGIWEMTRGPMTRSPNATQRITHSGHLNKLLQSSSNSSDQENQMYKSSSSFLVNP